MTKLFRNVRRLDTPKASPSQHLTLALVSLCHLCASQPATNIVQGVSSQPSLLPVLFLQTGASKFLSPKTQWAVPPHLLQLLYHWIVLPDKLPEIVIQES